MNYSKQIKNIQELNTFLESLFTNSKYFQDVKWSEIENGKKIEITMGFWYGTFNEYTIKYIYVTDYSKEVWAYKLLMSILGDLTQSSFYYFKIVKGCIKIYKGPEMMG